MSFYVEENHDTKLRRSEVMELDPGLASLLGAAQVRSDETDFLEAMTKTPTIRVSEMKGCRLQAWHRRRGTLPPSERGSGDYYALVRGTLIHDGLASRPGWREQRLWSTLVTRYGEVTITGRIDLIERDSDGNLVVTDYKSTCGRLSPTLRDDWEWQIKAYAWLLSENRIPGPYVARVVQMGSGLQAFEKAIEPLEIDTMVEAIEAMLQDAPPPGEPRLGSWECKYCDLSSCELHPDFDAEFEQPTVAEIELEPEPELIVDVPF